MPRPRLTALACLLAATAGVLVAAPSAPAGATSAQPATPTGVHLRTATGSSLTVAANRAANATGYRVFASTVRSDVYVANISRARVSAVSRTPVMTVGGFRFTSAAVYYRVETLNGTRHAWDPTIHTGGLKPATPSGVRATASASGPYLSWTSGAGTGFLVYQATDPSLTAGRHVYRLRGSTARFSPYSLSAGGTYYFRVRRDNHGTASGYSALVSMSVSSRQQAVRVMTYNIMEGTTAGQTESGQTIPSWATRRAGVVGLIRQAAPDVVAVQEGAAWVGSPQGYGGTRQVDDLVRALGGQYALAATEVPPTQHGYLRTGNYVLFRTDSWRALGVRGHWFLGTGQSHTAAYQLLRNVHTGATFLATSAHLAVGAGAAADTERQTEARDLIADARAAAAGAPVVYSGDFNSDVNRNHAFDGPGLAMRAAGIVDAEDAAQTLVNTRYNSANLYLRTPPAVDQSIDHLYAPAGVAVVARSVLLNLSGGRFVGVIPSDHNPVLASLYVSY